MKKLEKTQRKWPLFKVGKTCISQYHVSQNLNQSNLCSMQFCKENEKKTKFVHVNSFSMYFNTDIAHINNEIYL